MAESMIRRYYCESCGSTFEARFNDWYRVLELWCLRCDEVKAWIPEFVIQQMSDDERVELEKLKPPSAPSGEVTYG